MIVDRSSYCYAHLPRAGLGNKLFVWAKAAVFAHINELPLKVSSWSQLNIGSILRSERVKRSYGDYFDDTNAISIKRQLFAKLTHEKVYEPSIEQINDADKLGKVFVFNNTPHWSDYFKDIKGYREYISDSLLHMLDKKCRKQLNSLSTPVIGIHVRMGDFRRLQPCEEFKDVGHVRTPLSYFIELIELIRALHGSCLPVTLFSDGYDEELEELLRLPNIARFTGQPDIVEMLLLSKSRVVVTSAGSTFSYWSGFMANAPLIIHHEHIHAPLRPDTVNSHFFEGGIDISSKVYPAMFIENVKSIVY